MEISGKLSFDYVVRLLIEVNYYRVELDREQEAILEHEDRGLGLKGEWRGKDNWYGGRIQQIAKMEFVQDTNSFIIRLEKMQMTRSHRFARFLGSRRLLQMKNSGDRRDIALERKFLMQRFILCGRVFVPFSSKDGKVYLMETNDDYERTPSDAEGDQHRLSLEEFVQWHNPMSLNQRQVRAIIAKTCHDSYYRTASREVGHSL